MRASTPVGWSTYADQPLDHAQRDALVLAVVRKGSARAKRWKVPGDWPGAWVSAWPSPVDDEAGRGRQVWLEGAGDWFAAAAARAEPASGRRPPRGSALTLQVGAQVVLWRRRYPLALRGPQEGPDELAAHHGPALADLADGPTQVLGLGWGTAELAGWSAGGPLHLDCPDHGAPLRFWRCNHSEAVTRKRRLVTACPDCAPEEAARLSKRLRPLLAARAALDAELESPGAASPATASASAASAHTVYVVEAVDRSGGVGLYVGQTAGEPADRIATHRAGGDGAARVFRGKATVGEARPDLVPEDWVLPSRSAGLAAEAFTHRLLQAREPGARVHGDADLLGG